MGPNSPPKMEPSLRIQIPMIRSPLRLLKLVTFTRLDFSNLLIMWFAVEKFREKAVDNTAVANYFCLRQLPPSWTAWTDVTSCTVSCGNGTILRQAECRYNTGLLGDTW